jgi:hypothetical protein
VRNTDAKANFVTEPPPFLSQRRPQSLGAGGVAMGRHRPHHRALACAQGQGWGRQRASDIGQGKSGAAQAPARSTNVALRLHLGPSRTSFRSRISAHGGQGGRGRARLGGVRARNVPVQDYATSTTGRARRSPIIRNPPRQTAIPPRSKPSTRMTRHGGASDAQWRLSCRAPRQRGSRGGGRIERKKPWLHAWSRASPP